MAQIIQRRPAGGALASSLLHSLYIIASAVGRKFGVNLQFRGMKAETDGKTITLPAMEVVNDTLRKALVGFLIHESGHIRFSNFAPFQELGSELRRKLLNIIEDVRMEQEVFLVYPGFRDFLENTVRFAMSTGIFSPVTADAHPAMKLTGYVLYRLRVDHLQQNDLHEMADEAEALVRSTFPGGVVTRLNGLLSQVEYLANTTDALALADSILLMLDEEQKEEEERQRRQKANDREDRKKDQGENGTSEQTPDGAASQANDPNGQQGNPPDQGGSGQPGQPSAGQDQGGGADQSTDQGDGTDGNSPGQAGADPSVKSAPQSGQGSGTGSGEADPAAIQKTLAATPDQMVGDSYQKIGEQLSDSAQSAVVTRQATILPVIPVPKDRDVDAAIGKGAVERVNRTSCKMRATLQGLVQASRDDRVSLERRGSRIDGGALMRAVAGDPRVFVRREKRQRPNTVVHILLDRSGSMSRSIIDHSGAARERVAVAQDASLALAMALEGINGTNPAVSAFPGESADERSIVTLKRHGERSAKAAGRFSIVASGGTPLGGAIWFAASCVLEQKEPRKILMIITDGQPDNPVQARDVIERCEATGITVIGIGIGVDVSHLCPISMTINDVSDLKSTLFQITKNIMIA